MLSEPVSTRPSQRAAGSLPTVSASWAMARHGEARRAERDTLCDLLRLAPGAVVIDVQAAGGFVADEIYRRLAGAAQCLCIEPCAELRARLSPVHRPIADPVHAWASISDGIADAVVGLAGLHHSASARGTVGEAFRALKPGGQFAVCDVVPGSPMARWLNEFVDRHSQAGHEGLFYSRAELGAMLDAAGFGEVRIEEKSVPWRFANRAQLIEFALGLFGLDCTAGAVARGLQEYLVVTETSTGVVLDWHLNYAVAWKPAPVR